LVIGTNVLAQQTIGIANDNLVEIDDADAADNDYAKFTANGLEGRSYAEVKSDLGLGTLAEKSEIDDIDQIAAGVKLVAGESFVDSDANLMTAAAINDRIESFGYGTGNGDMTGVSITASDPLDISQSNTTSGNYSATISLDASEFGSYLTDMTDLVVGGTDELAVLDNGTLKRKQIDEIRLTAFDSTGFSSGISFNGSTANGLLTYGNSTTADVESELTYDGTDLQVGSANADTIIKVAGTRSMFGYDNANFAIVQGGNTKGIKFNTNTDTFGGSPKMTITTAGDVGVGTESPSGRLNVVDSDGSVLAKFQDSDSSHSGIIIAADTNGGHIGNSGGYAGEGIYFQDSIEVMRFYAAGGEKMRLTGTGRLGIGTTSPGEKLTIKAGGTTSQEVIKIRNSSNTEVLSVGIDSGGDGYLNFNTSPGTINTNGGHLVLSPGGSGNVGIGTTDPASYNNDGDDFVIYGTGNTGMSIASGTSSNGSIMFADGTGGTAGYRGAIKYNHGSDYMHFNTAAAERVRIDSAGKVGIGNTAPFAKLHISNGTAGVSALDFEDVSSCAIFVDAVQNTNYFQPLIGVGENATTFTAAISSYDAGGSAAQGLAFHTGNTNAITEAMRIDSSQDAHFDQDVIAFSSTPSDIRLKENFEKIENGLDVVSKLEGHTFNWKKSGDRLSAGFKAQEVEKILPHLVDEKKLPLKADDDKEYKILRYEEMIPYLVEAIKEQQEEIDLLKANYDQLKYNRR